MTAGRRTRQSTNPPIHQSTNSPIRIGFDMDGVIADFASAYRDVERRLFGTARGRAGEPEREEQARSDSDASPEVRRRQDPIWKDIEATPDFWVSLRPLDESGVRRIHELMLRHRWEVVFLTQRPAT